MTDQTFFQPLKRSLILLLVATVAWLQMFLSAPAQAGEATYVDAEGRDLTAVVECLPENYGKGDLESAIAKFGNDYLERVFRLKEDTKDYKVSEDEQQFQQCLQQKGIRPKS